MIGRAIGMANSAYEVLFEPVQIGPVVAPNRFFAAPHATGHGFALPGGSTALRAMKAEGGWGTVAVQITEISEDSDMGAHPIERIWGDVYLDQHVRQVDAIKKHGSLAAIELGHGGMRARNFMTGLPVIGPSDLPILRAEIPVQAKAMDRHDIREFRRAHRKAAENAKAAGYDILYVYAAHDISILSHFLSRRTNFRTDEYGGSIENRARLLREVLEDTLEVANGECAVALRFAVHEKGTKKALTYDGEGREVVEMLAEMPDLWDVNISSWASDSATSRFTDQGYQVDFMSFVKMVTTKPVVGVGRYTSPDMMASLVRSGKLDLVGAARPSIADPFLPNKIKNDRIENIRECIGCNVCVSMDSYGVPLRCTQNPTISEEWSRGWHPENIPREKQEHNSLIVGGGPAGLEAALTLARAGHHVTLAEASEHLGGRALRESALPGLHTYRWVSEYREYQLQQMGNVDIYKSSPLELADLSEFGADNIVIATGANWRADGVGGSNFDRIEWDASVNVITPEDVMAGIVPKGPVVIYDDDHYYIATAIAEKLCKQGVDVTYVTPAESVGAWTVQTLEQKAIISRLKQLGVTMLVNGTLVDYIDEELTLSDRYSADDQYVIRCETLVFVGARMPKKSLFGDAKDALPNTRVVSAGDCLVPGMIQAAVHSGHRVARSLLEGATDKVLLDKPADWK